MIRWRTLLLAFGVSTALSFVAAGRDSWGASLPKDTAAESACRSDESWRFSKSMTEAAGPFRAFLSEKTTPMRSFSQGMALRRRAKGVEEKRFSEYWIARSLHQMGNLHSAVAGFEFLAKEFPDDSTVGIQVAALDCLNAIRENNPGLVTLAPMQGRIKQLLALTDQPKQLRVLWSVSTGIVMEMLAEGASKSDLQPVLSLLDGAGPYQNLGSGLVAASSNDPEGAIDQLRRFQKSLLQPTGPAKELVRYGDQARLIVARSLYLKRRYPEALEELRKIDKSSNELVDALSELAWSALRAEKYPEAIGAALNLQSGGLARTFAPEAPMVMAMALNEICQYPESLQATEGFRKRYEASYAWLSRWNSNRSERNNLHQLAVDFLKKRKAQVPERVASEWVRSPVFIRRQEELNLIGRQRIRLSEESRLAIQEQKRLGQEIQLAAGPLLNELREAKRAKKTSAVLQKKVAEFRVRVGEYRDFRRASLGWRGIVQRFEPRMTHLEQTLKNQIQRDLASRSTRMLRILEDVAENNQLIEAEIYQGASRDIIWQNAHPDYKEVLAGLNGDRARPSASKVWDWGHSSALAEEWSEIWEDELGSFKATLFDNCLNKEKYLAIKTIRPVDAYRQAQAKSGAKP